MIKHLTIFGLLVFTASAYAQTQVPNEFQAGQPARAADVNANFDALEASIDDSAADIAANTTSIKANTNAINTLLTSAGMGVYSADGVRIGRLIDLKNPGVGTLLIQNDTGYLLEIDIIGDGYLMEGSAYYAEPNCAGTMYTFLAMDWAGTTGTVLRHRVNNEVYYWPRGSTPVQVTLLSERQLDGSCLDGLSWNTVAAAVLPNDEAITGVSSVMPAKPLSLSPPN